MSIFSIGEVIRKRRNLLGISQEELAYGICSVPTLSRVENGERVPSKANFDALMQRMGQSGEMYDAYIGDNDFEVHEKKFYIRQAIINNRIEEARAILKELKTLVDNDDNLTNQFIKYAEVVTRKSQMSSAEILSELEEAIKITQSKYGKVKINNCLLTFDEITILNIIANAYGSIGNNRKAINMFYELKDYMDSKYINSEEIARTYPMILYNLSKWLGLEGRYDECIEICDIGIKISVDSGKMAALAKLLYNKAWCLVKNGQNDSEEFKKILLQAYYVAEVMGNYESAQKYKEFGLNNCTLLNKDCFY